MHRDLQFDKHLIYLSHHTKYDMPRGCSEFFRPSKPVSPEIKKIFARCAAIELL
ncbi:MAG: hypothetical protein QOD03_955 [Verrucomicrobiota bacterium]|jgi:hypothetical protein